jgi:integrase
MTNIHNHNPRRRLEAILESDKISKQNKEDLKEFYHTLKEGNKGKARQVAYLSKAKVILEHEGNDLRLKDADKLQLTEINDQIDNSAYYHKEYAPETKKEYRKFLRIYSKWAEKDTVDRKVDVPEKARSFKAYVSENVKNRTNPSDLPTPQDIKQLCKALPLRLRALYLTHWDLGSRINETMRSRVGDYDGDGEKSYLYVRVNPEQSEEGAKSDRRKCRVKIAAPVIDRWLEEEHPKPEDDDAFLFCRIRKTKEGDPRRREHIPANYNHMNTKIKKKASELGIDSDIKSHTVRKGRTSFLKSGLGIQESQVDKRIGHVIGSEITREYTRLDDSDSNNAYGEAYGEDNPEDKEESDLVPLVCEDCGQTNAGYRDRCYSCNGLLEIKEIEEIKEKKENIREDSDELRKLIWETIEEEGLAEELTGE